jgi:hypothetical protein
MALSTYHERMLMEDSGISPEIAESRGYHTAEKKAELKRLGFPESQCLAPALVMPVYSPTGEISLYQIRPDTPRIGKDGKLRKYEIPNGAGMKMDVHPSTRDKLDDPSVPLFITEGIKKGDALVSRDLCAVALLGVSCYRGRNEKGGKTILAEWEYIALNDGRQVYIVFDSDIMLKQDVYNAMGRIKGFAESRGAAVAVVYLPSGEGGKKRGVDDFLAEGYTVDDLLSLASADLKEPPEDAQTAPEADTQSAILVHYANKLDLFHTPDGEPFVTIPMED